MVRKQPATQHYSKQITLLIWLISMNYYVIGCITDSRVKSHNIIHTYVLLRVTCSWFHVPGSAVGKLLTGGATNIGWKTCWLEVTAGGGWKTDWVGADACWLTGLEGDVLLLKILLVCWEGRAGSWVPRLKYHRDMTKKIEVIYIVNLVQALKLYH